MRDPLSFDVIISARPDILYSQPFDPNWLPLRARKPTIRIPEFHTEGGLNDRFAVGSPGAMIKYMLRGHDYMELHLSSKPGVHKRLTGEKFLALWARQNRVKMSPIPWSFARIRADGRIAEKDREFAPAEHA